MDKNDEVYYEEQFNLFASQGWKDLISKVEDIRDVAADITAIKTSEQFHMAKGQVDILDWLLSWENAVRMAHKSNE